MQELERMELVLSSGRVWLVSATRWETNVEWTITARKMRNAVSVAVNACVWTQQRLTRKLKQNQDSAQSLGWVRRVYVIAVVIRAVKMSTARVASYVVLMDANWTALTLVSDETSSLLNATCTCKRTQYCWPTTPNIVGCYMLRPFAHPAVVACCWGLLRKVWNRLNVYQRASGCNNSQSCWPTMLRPFALWAIGEGSSQRRKTCWFWVTKFFRS